MHAHVLPLEKATFGRRSGRITKVLRPARRRRGGWPDARSAAFQWTAYRLAPRA
jgi:hypothetical protein